MQLDQRKRVHLNYPDYSGIILDESQSGRTINVQRGFEVDQNRVNQKEEAEISTGDSSNIQKSRHSSLSSGSSSSSSSTSETRRIQLNPTGEKPEVLTTTYTHNSSGTSSSGSADSSSNRGGVVFHTESSGSYGSTNLGGGFRGSEEGSLGSRLPDLDQSYGTRRNQSVRVESRWEESSEAQGRTISPAGRYGSVMTESERRYQELLRQQEEARLRQEEETRREEETRHKKLQEEELLIQRQEEQKRIALHRQREEERRQEERQREEWRREEEERRRQQEERRLQEERKIQKYNYDEDRRHGVTTSGHHRITEDDFITGDREETIGSREFALHNVSSTQELERIFGALSKDAASYQLYNRQGQQYVQFKARFRTSADRKEYIEFQDGSMFPLQDRYGGQSYISESMEPRDSRFLRIEGQLLIAPDGKGYIMLKDGRRFPLQGSFTHTEERTYTLGGPHDGHQGGDDDNQRQGTYSQSWHEESSSHGVTSDGDSETRYNTRTHEERRTEERTSNTRVYGRNRFNDESSTNRPDPNFPSSRYRRESDVIDVEQFKKFERLHRHRRDLDESDNSPSDATAFEDDDYYQESDAQSQLPIEPIEPCDAAKCVMLRCVLGPLKKDQEVWISARYRVDARTLKEVALEEKVKVSTKLVARVTKQPFIGTPAEMVVRSDEVMTNIEPSAAPSVPDMIPIWVVVLSACAGMIILLLLIYLLYKVSREYNVEKSQIVLFQIFCK